MITDEQLTLYFYGDELNDADTRATEQALEDDAALAARYRALGQELHKLGSGGADIAVPPEFIARLHDSLIAAAEANDAESDVAPAVRLWPAFAVAATVCLVGLLAVFALRAPVPVAVPATTVVQPESDVDRAAVSALRSVQSHLMASRLQLVSVELAGQSERSEVLLELLARNRSAARRAQMSGNADLARVLRAMQLLLATLAQTAGEGGDLDPAVLAQIEFELNAMLTKLDAPPSDSSISL